MKKIKKMVAACVVLTIIMSMLAGCGKASDDTQIRIGSLKGPTSMGLLFLMQEAEAGGAEGNYAFTMATQADEVLPLMVKGEMDIALVPANVASVLYNKMQGQLAVIDINTLGVLYMVTGDSTIESVEDLKGRTIYLTGKGTTPDYVLHYILSENGMTEADYTLEYKSEASEVAALLAEKPEAVGLLPQPFVTAACIQNEALKVVLDMNEEWAELQGEDGSRMVTGVTVVRKEFLEEHEAAVKVFLKEHEESTGAINDDAQAGASLAVAAGIVAKEPIAQKAIPECNITCIQGEEMKQALSGYLEVLFEQNPESVGGALPDEGFYYIP
ncbi:MAG: ABC transporter substrate-binding protein [Lachnospiraceae bacterium]|nr:ABC transporter substrate-binding protein [Lachnospiraceae bacterium]